jgi:2-dehydropantoate 2-reductase
MRNRVGAETAIISVMNGIESEERIGEVYGMEKVLYAVTMGIDALREGNRVTYTTQGKLFWGRHETQFLRSGSSAFRLFSTRRESSMKHLPT